MAKKKTSALEDIVSSAQNFFGGVGRSISNFTSGAGNAGNSFYQRFTTDFNKFNQQKAVQAQQNRQTFSDFYNNAAKNVGNYFNPSKANYKVPAYKSQNLFSSPIGRLGRQTIDYVNKPFEEIRKESKILNKKIPVMYSPAKRGLLALTMPQGVIQQISTKIPGPREATQIAEGLLGLFPGARHATNIIGEEYKRMFVPKTKRTPDQYLQKLSRLPEESIKDVASLLTGIPSFIGSPFLSAAKAVFPITPEKISLGPLPPITTYQSQYKELVDQGMSPFAAVILTYGQAPFSLKFSASIGQRLKPRKTLAIRDMVIGDTEYLSARNTLINEFGFTPSDFRNGRNYTTQFRRNALRWHPDRPGGSSEKFKRLVSAYEKTKDIDFENASIMNEAAQEVVQKAAAQQSQQGGIVRANILPQRSTIQGEVLVSTPPLIIPQPEVTRFGKLMHPEDIRIAQNAIQYLDTAPTQGIEAFMDPRYAQSENTIRQLVSNYIDTDIGKNASINEVLSILNQKIVNDLPQTPPSGEIITPPTPPELTSPQISKELLGEAAQPTAIKGIPEAIKTTEEITPQPATITDPATEFNLKIEELRPGLKSVLTNKELSDLEIITRGENKIITPDGKIAQGKNYKALIELVEKNGMVSDVTAYHEAGHYAMQTMDSNTVNAAVDQAVEEGLAPTREEALEVLLDGVREQVSGRQTFVGRIRAFIESFINRVREIINQHSRIQKLYDEMLGGRRVAPQENISLEQLYRATEERLQPELTTTILKQLGDRKVVEPQFIEDLTNQPQIRQVERNLIREALQDAPLTKEGKVDVPAFIERVKNKLLPLKSQETRDFSHESTTLSEEIRGPIANYIERIYESPIQTSAGNIHYSDVVAPNYFAHTRIEDLPDPRAVKKAADYGYKLDVFYDNKIPQGSTRRIIEIQSDLFQRGGLEREKSKFNAFKDIQSVPVAQMRNNGWSEDAIKREILKAKDPKVARAEFEKQFSQLEPYRNTWHERAIREEIKLAAQRGKEILQFPTGETIMKIEGLGETAQWMEGSTYFSSLPQRLTPEKLKVGNEIYENGVASQDDAWIITDVLGDGKFKAVSKDKLLDPRYNAGLKSYDPGSWTIKNALAAAKEISDTTGANALGGLQEQFDISGRIDTQNAQYIRYEKTFGNFLKRIRPDLRRITDPQGVTWFETTLTPEDATGEIPAFRITTKKGENPYPAGSLKHEIFNALKQDQDPMLAAMDVRSLKDKSISDEVLEKTVQEVQKEFYKQVKITKKPEVIEPEIITDQHNLAEKIFKKPEEIKAELDQAVGTTLEPPSTPPIAPEGPLPGQKERGHIKTIKKSERFREEVKLGVSGFYDPIVNEDVYKEGVEFVKNNFEASRQRALSDEPLNLELEGIHDALAENLTQRADIAEQTGNLEEAEALDAQLEELENKLAEKATPMAQAMQYLRRWSQESPTAMVRWAKRILEQANQGWQLSPTRLVKRAIGAEFEVKFTPEMKTMILEKMRKIKRIRDQAERAEAVLKLKQEVVKDIHPSVLQYTDAYRYQNMLIGPRTQLRNIYWGAINSQLIKPALAAQMGVNDFLTRGLTGQERKYFVSDAFKYYRGSWNAFGSAVEQFQGILQGQLDYTHPDFQRVGLERLMQHKIPWFLDISKRFMEGTDKFNATMVAGGELDIQRSQGVDEQTAQQEAAKAAAYWLNRIGLDPFNKTGQGKILSGADRVIETFVKAGRNVPLFRYFVPFVKIVGQFTKMTMEFNPVTGPATLWGSTRKEEQVSKMMLGSYAMLGAAALAFAGRTTWAAPEGEEEKKIFYASGRIPFAVELYPGRWVSMFYFGPLMLSVAIPAAFKYYTEDAKTALTDSKTEAITKFLFHTLNFWAETTPMSGVGGFVKTATGDVDFNVFKNLGFTAGQFVPFNNLLGYVNSFFDPVFRKTGGFTDELLKNIPGYSKKLDYYETPTGEPAKRNIFHYIAPWNVGISDPLYENQYQEAMESAQLKYAERKVKEELKKEVLREERKQRETGIEGSTSGIRTIEKGNIKREYIHYVDNNGDFNLIEMSKYDEELTGIDKFKQQSKKYSDARKIYGIEDMSDEDKSTIFDRWGLEKEDVEYDYFSSQESEIKSGYFMDLLSDQPKEDILKTLITARKESISGKILANDTTVNNLYEDGLITYGEAKYIKSFKLNKEGTNVGTSGAGRGRALPKFKITATPKPKAVKVKVSRPKSYKPLKGKSLKVKKFKNSSKLALKPPTLKAPRISLRQPVTSLGRLGNIA